MVNSKLARIMAMMAALAISGLFTITAAAADVPRMTIEVLKEQLDSPDVIVVDVRTNNSWKKSDFKIKGAVRVESKKLISWAKEYPKDKKFVLYCT